MTEPDPRRVEEFDTAAIELGIDRPHPARVDDYLRGGRTHFDDDRELAETCLATNPQLRATAHGVREFIHRAVAHLARAGIRQFLDCSTGIPTPGYDIHDTAHAIDPTCRVVHADPDPLVHAHHRALLAPGDPRVSHVRADPRDPRALWGHPLVRAALDTDAPIALLMGPLLQYVDDDHTAHHLAHALCAPLPSGSHLVLTHLTDTPEHHLDGAVRAHREHGITLRTRTAETLRYILPGNALHPGIVPAHRWRPHPDTPSLQGVCALAAVYRLAVQEGRT